MQSLRMCCPLFFNMTEEEFDHCLRCSRSEVVLYRKDEPIFFQEDKPQKLFILVEGMVAVCRDSASGKRTIVTAIRDPGELFGEVFLFLNKNAYDHYAVAVNDTRILQMPKEFLTQRCEENCRYHTQLITNMLSILAEKAYYLNRKLQILSSPGLRQKIAKLLLQNLSEGGAVRLPMNREELADFLNVARPSLSRELMKMQEDGLLHITGKNIKVLDEGALQDLL